jgi:hypothetical protein
MRLISLFARLIVLAFAASSAVAGDHTSPWPDPSKFQSGDLLWPNKPGVFIPYNSGDDRPANLAEKAWIDERDKYLNSISGQASSHYQRQASAFRNMSFDDFYNKYAGDRERNEIILYSNAGPFDFVGHVAMIEVTADGTSWILEATLRGGVNRLPYSLWSKSLQDSLIWHGRLRGFSQAERSAIIVEAKKYIGRPYDFWNFDLNDDAGFYCSKLIWLSAFRALHTAVDGNTDSRRIFWFSPKQLLNSAGIAKLHNPGNYSRP